MRIGFWIAAVSGACVLAAPASAGITLVHGTLGTVSATDNVDDYSICDGNEEWCETLPFGGRYQRARMDLTLTNSSGLFTVDIWQGSDYGGSLDAEFIVNARFEADSEVRVFFAGVNSYQQGDRWQCSQCGWFAAPVIHSYAIGGGRWAVEFEGAAGAWMRAGDQDLLHSFRFRIAEVPEPATWAMLIAGFGLVGAAARRRRDALAA